MRGSFLSRCAVLCLTLLAGLVPCAAASADASLSPADASPSPAPDVTAPVTVVTGADDRWHNGPVTLTFAATDEAGGSGVAATWCRVDDQDWVLTGPLVVDASPDHGNDGLHVVTFYSVDHAGNAEVAQSRTVRIDTTGSQISVWARRTRDGKAMALWYRVDDALSPKATAVRISVFDSHDHLARRFTLSAAVSTGVDHVRRWRPRAQDTYHCTVTAADLAGNAAEPAGAVTFLARGPWWTVIGRSVQGRRIVAARFGSGPRHVLFVGGVHGNEAGTAVVKRFVAYLRARPGAVPRGARVDVVRCANPDGYVHRWRGNAHHVDLNRNLPSRNWRSHLLPGGEPAGSALTGGPRPASEPETRALLAWLRRGGYRAVISLHSRAGLLDCSGPGSAALGRLMSARCGLPLGHLSYQSSITGSLGDYVPERYHVPIVTVELLGTAFTPGLRAAFLAAAAGP